MRISFVSLIFSILPVSISSSLVKNDCRPKGMGDKAIHACRENTISDKSVAMDASLLNATESCECILRHTGSTATNFVAFVDLKTGSHKRIQFAVDGVTYSEPSSDKMHTASGDSIKVVASYINNHGIELRDGNPCLIFKLSENSNDILNLTCFNASEGTPREHGSEHSMTSTSTTPTTVKPTTQTTTSTTTLAVKVTTAEQSTEPTTGGLKASSDRDVSTSQSRADEVTTSVITQESTVLNEQQAKTPSKSNVTLVVIVVVLVGVLTLFASVLAVCLYRRRNKERTKEEDNAKQNEEKATRTKESEYEMTENAMYVPMELQGNTEQLYNEPDLDGIPGRDTDTTETKPLIQGQEPNEGDAKMRTDTSNGNSDKAGFVEVARDDAINADGHKANEDVHNLYTQVDKNKPPVKNAVTASDEKTKI